MCMCQYYNHGTVGTITHYNNYKYVCIHIKLYAHGMDYCIHHIISMHIRRQTF